LWNLVVKNLWVTIKIIFMVTTLMILIEYLEVKFKDKIREKITGKPLNQYVMASLLGAIPGCMDAFLVVSLYIHGIVGFGALAAVMLSTAGDEAFIMLAMVPEAALKIFFITILLGIIGGFLADKTVKRLKVKTCEHCVIEIHEEITGQHFLKEHVYGHILKKHIPKLFLWIFFPLTVVEILIQNYDFSSVISGLILYSKGMIPFSVLLVNTLSQDGHGLLPLFSHTIKDTLYVQIFTTGFSLVIGIILLLIGA